jgi:hypothetical protein
MEQTFVVTWPTNFFLSNRILCINILTTIVFCHTWLQQQKFYWLYLASSPVTAFQIVVCNLMTYGLDMTSCGLWNVVQFWVTYESIESIMNFIQSRVHVEKESSSVDMLVSNACVTFVIASESMPQILKTVSSLANQIFFIQSSLQDGYF